MKPLCNLMIFIFLFFSNVHGQSIGINGDGSLPHASAMLDVKSGSKGFLMPRMDSTARKNISSPAKGLMVYDTSDSNLWQYDGSTWSTQLKLPGSYIFNYGAGEILSITNNGSTSPIYANCTYGGGTGIETHGGRYGLFSKSDGGTGAMSSVGVVGTYYGGFTLNGTYFPSTGGIGVLALGGGGFGPSFSLNAFHFGLFAAAKDYGIYATAPQPGIAALFKGQTWFQGTTHYSHINYGTNEDTYLRGGKDNAVVIIADEPGQKAGVGTSTTDPNAKLTVADANSNLYTGINSTGSGLFTDTIYNDVGGAALQRNDHRAAVKAVGVNGASALDIDGQVAVSGNNKFVFSIYPQNSNINNPGFVVQNGSLWEIRLNHTILDDISFEDTQNGSKIYVTPFIGWSDFQISSVPIPVRQILWLDWSSGIWKWLIDVNPMQSGKPQIQLNIMVIRWNPSIKGI